MRKSLNLTSISKKYGQGYAAFIKSTNKVLAFSKRVDWLVNKIKDRKEFKENKVTIGWVPKPGARYVFRCF